MKKKNLKNGIFVIGLGYGDEGKGNLVNHLCKTMKEKNKEKAIVVRFSGGDQCGHTVVQDGKSHIFSTIGSGAIQGISTYYTFQAIFNPYTYKVEAEELLKNFPEANTEVLLDLKVRVSTVYDKIANHLCEKNMADGTCGKGVYKTVQRHEHVPFFAIDLVNPITALAKLESIKEYYNFDEEVIKRYKDEIDAYKLALVQNSNFAPISYRDIAQEYTHYIFEGSQGTLLDPNFGVLPHVTATTTCTEHSQYLFKMFGIKSKTVIGVTRTYATRHGAGPFEENPISLVNTQYETNKDNLFQGPFKISALDFSQLMASLYINYSFLSSTKTTLNIAFTCCDQVEESVVSNLMEEALNVPFINNILASDSPEGNFKILRQECNEGQKKKVKVREKA